MGKGTKKRRMANGEWSFFCNFAARTKDFMKKKHSITLFCLVVIMTSILFSCENIQRKQLKGGHADSLIFAAGATMDYDRMLELTDSFENAGDISPIDANRWRGTSYYHQNMYRMAEICYRKVLEGDVKSEQDQLSYNKSARRLSELLLVKGDFEGALEVAVPAVAQMDKTGIGSDIDYAILLNNIGCCQLNLGRDEEADKSFKTARGHYANRWQSDSTSRGFQEAVLGTVYTSMAYINTRRYAESIYWIDRTEMLLDKYRERPDARKEYFDEYQGRIEIMRAVALQGLDKTKEASEAYQRFKRTNYSRTDAGRINANEYLVAAKRYQEAADNYRCLDRMLTAWDMEPSLDNIQLYLLPKYRANAEAGRLDSARMVADRIFSLLDTAITHQKNSSMAELATIYSTNEKEAEIARQQTRMSRFRLISSVVALTLIVIFLVVYVLLRRKAQHKLRDAHSKLEDAHSQLQSAYDQLETTTKAKERIESELRIARDIQNSMVPNVFPNRPGLDLYASMTPAKEVGGDLYSYLMLDDELYFCVGDVSGKGVPASLFMAQCTRLFRTLAAQHMKPSEIATNLNLSLTENNEQGMFVTMFIGLADLKTGRLVFCNAGHNPPIYGVEGDDHFMDIESNAPLGLWPDMEFVDESIDNIKGKMLLVYSDGLNEAENRQQEQFGDDHLLDLMNSHYFHTTREAIDFLNGEVIKHRDGAEPNDDLTMLCLFVK